MADGQSPPLHKRIRLDRSLTSYSRVQTIMSAVVSPLVRNIWTGATGGAEYVNIGCGPNIAPGFVNLDYMWRPGLQVCWDATKRLPFPENSVRGVFTEHCLEHVPLSGCRNALGEIFRILRPGGIVRVIVPDAALWLGAYAKGGAFPCAEVGRLPIEEVNSVFRDHGHLFAYDFDMMARLLRESGFTAITRRRFGVGGDRRLLIDTESREPESLYVEGAKPHDSV